MQFKDIPGNEIIKQRLIKTVRENRVSHAQLFLGPEGSGKLPMAIAYAQYISCQNKKEDDSCGICPSCVKYQNLMHPDLHFIYPIAKRPELSKNPISKELYEQWRDFLLKNNYFVSLNQWHDFIDIGNKQTNINVADCNNLVKTFSMKSYESEYKVMIIWIAEKLYHSAAPKILKILEEPFDKSLFILIAEDQNQLLQTILSRTKLVKFLPYSDDEIKSYIQKQENLTDIDISATAILSNGNITKASLLIKEGYDNSFYFTFFRNWMLNCFRPNITNLKSLIEDISKKDIGREKQKELLLYGIKIMRNSLLINNDNINIIRASENEKDFIIKFSKMINIKNAVLFIEDFNKAIYHIERNANPKILFMDLSFKCIDFFRIS